MGRFITFVIWFWALSMCAVGAWAETRDLISPPPTLPISLATVGPNRVILHDVQPESHRVVLEIRCPDVTSMPSRSELHLSFDARIADVSEPRHPMPLRLETAVTAQRVSLFLARDPFAFPQPWSYLVTIAFDQLPHSGTITWGSLSPESITYPALSPVEHGRALPGT